MPRFFTSFLSLFLLFACVSRTTQDVRFHDGAAAPRVEVALPDNDHFTFAIVGDTHVGNGDTSRLQRILSAASSEGDSFIVLLGDIVDKGEEIDFLAVKTALEAAGFSGKTIFAIGNHDVFNDGWTYFARHFGASHYSVDIGNARFVVLDTADGMVGKTHSQWLHDEMAKARPTHTFLVSHYLPMIPGQRTYLRLSDEREAMQLMKEATVHSVSAWFGAHYHSYAVEKVEGVDYVVAGGGGGRRMEPVKDFFFVQVTVNGSDISYRLNRVD